ncbi:MAG: DEAD/DEAH box helicase [Verrucomicrobia bacterium]|nr:DEAD/DEAH box helicase [Verrucomicrobiota bacterium]
MAFSKLELSHDVLQGVRAAGYTDPTPIQARVIPLVLGGRDIIGCAQTGTGKTAAFALPILTKLDQPGKLRALVLEPTRELAAQVETAFRDYGRFTKLRIAVIYGGVGYAQQEKALREGVDVIVATPGRLLDHMQQGRCKLDHIEFLILDEADRMLDMGFLPDVKRIIDRCAKKRQTMLFSATVPPEIATLTQWALTNPETIEVGRRRSPAETIRHALYPVADDQRDELLLELLKRTEFESVLVFCRMKDRADHVAAMLHRAGHSTTVLHSNRTQNEREQALRGFRDGRFEVMVATDIAARGLDIEDVSHVINYDMPQHAEDYVHRIGRTGRALATGDAFTIMTAEDRKQVHAIEFFIGASVPRVKLENFPYKYTTLLDSEAEKRLRTMGRRRR